MSKIIKRHLAAGYNNPGKVILAGAGPGAPDLIAVKAARYLQQADVVLADRLVGQELLDEYVRPGTAIIFVGKQCGSSQSTQQELINELMVDYANLGKLVVRLKGGDASVFSNILDELSALVQNKISYEIIPGITAASGAAAYAGIPLTARGYSKAVRFITHYRNEISSPQAWQDLATTSDTLVFYMSSGTLHNLTEKLLSHGADPALPVAIIEQATTPYQYVEVYELGVINKIATPSFVSPTLVIIGKVAALHKEFAWLENKDLKQSYFQPLEQQLRPRKTA